MLANGENTTQDTTTLYSAVVVVKQHVLLVLSVLLCRSDFFSLSLWSGWLEGKLANVKSLGQRIGRSMN